MWRVFKLVALVAYVVLSAVLAAATFIEWRLGTPFVTSHVYGSWWFVVLMTAVVVPVSLSPSVFSAKTDQPFYFMPPSLLWLSVLCSPVSQVPRAFFISVRGTARKVSSSLLKMVIRFSAPRPDGVGLFPNRLLSAYRRSNGLRLLSACRFRPSHGLHEPSPLPTWLPFLPK